MAAAKIVAANNNLKYRAAKIMSVAA